MTEIFALQIDSFMVYCLCAVFNIRVKQQQKGKEYESKYHLHKLDA